MKVNRWLSIIAFSISIITIILLGCGYKFNLSDNGFIGLGVAIIGILATFMVGYQIVSVLDIKEKVNLLNDKLKEQSKFNEKLESNNDKLKEETRKIINTHRVFEISTLELQANIKKNTMFFNAILLMLKAYLLATDLYIENLESKDVFLHNFKEINKGLFCYRVDLEKALESNKELPGGLSRNNYDNIKGYVSIIKGKIEGQKMLELEQAGYIRCFIRLIKRVDEYYNKYTSK